MRAPCTGMDFYVNLERPGYRVARRRRATNKVGVQHKVTKEDAIKWCVRGQGCDKHHLSFRGARSNWASCVPQFASLSALLVHA